MNSERWRQIENIFHLALERDPQERSSFLAQACAQGDPALRREVESLIAYHEGAGSFLNEPAVSEAARILHVNRSPEGLNAPSDDYSLASDIAPQDDECGPRADRREHNLRLAEIARLVSDKTFGRYQVQELLGKGGMGEVYKVLDTQLNRFVALKVLRDKYNENEKCVKRFEQEARAVSGLNHPHILTIYDIGTLNGRTFITTEFVDGQTLRKRIQGGAIDPSNMFEIAFQTADALIAAHRAAILHRDLKPENIMLRNDGYVKLLDFGLAKLIDPSDSVAHTLPGVILGTPQYMSPEQARGSSVDARTDIWSFGVLLYEMVTGVCPFSGSTVDEVLDSVKTKEPPSLSFYKADVHPELALIITKAMSKNIEDRYESLSHVVLDLKRVEHHLMSAPSGVDYTKVRTSAAATLVANKASSPAKSRQRKTIKSVAILPFTNETEDPKFDYLSDGITETIINNLSQLPQLRVMSRNSVFRFKGKDLVRTVIGRELGVGALLTGKLLRVAGRLIVQTELVDVADGSQLWGAQFNRKSGDVLQIQEAIANDISEELKLNLSRRQRKLLSKRPTVKDNAYHSYLKGRFCWNKRSTEGLRQSINFFNNAIEFDPMFALAYAGIADAYAVLGNQHSMVLSDAYSKAKTAALRALAIDDTLAEAYPTLGYIRGAYDRDWNGSEEALRKAITLNPGYATAHQWYSAILRALGRVDEAIEEAETAFSLDPLSPIINANVGLCFYVARRYEEAAALFRRTITVEPEFFWSRYLLGLTQRQRGEYTQALTELRLALSLANDKPMEAVVLSDLAYTFGILKDEGEAHRLIGELKALAKVYHVAPYDLAVAHLGVGDKNTAFDWLEEAYRTRDEGLLWLKVDPVLDEVRNDPRYLTLLKQVGLNEPG